MNTSSRLPAALAYLPILGWLFVILLQPKNAAAQFHLRQSVGLFIFVFGVLAGWAVVAWILSWIPLMDVLAMGLFTIVMAAWIYGVVAWVLGLSNALSARMVPLPLFGRWADRRLRIR